MKIKKIFQLADKKGMAIGHFNVSNIETFEAAVQASKKTKTPIIIATSEGAIAHSGIDFFIFAKTYFEKKYGIDIYLHLDHGRDLNITKEAIRKGYDSVMIDASHYKFERNIKITKSICDFAHRFGVIVEAELGTIGGAEENVKSRKIQYTDPEKAQEFVDRTNCDLLAVAIGTSHGVNKFSKGNTINTILLDEIKHFVDIPLVLHGASGINQKTIKELSKYGVKLKDARGVSDSDIKRAIKGGIRKINIDTDLQLAMMLELRKELKDNPKNIKIYKILSKLKDSMVEEVISKIKLFSNK